MSGTGTVLVSGGAGYIGSHCVRRLLGQGRKVVVVDNLSTGDVRFLQQTPFVQGDIRNQDLLLDTFRTYGVTAVMHFAASCYVGESVSDPQKYYDNNVFGTLQLLSAMRAAGISHCIFSSSCAVYGDPQYLPLDENHRLHPVNPYGFTKRVVEEMLKDFARAYPAFRYVSLRYFNAAGADPDGCLGEAHEPETHLIPLILQVASGRREAIQIYGTDYDTPDGTCIRDYIHIDDIALAHLKSLNYLEQNGDSAVFNIGTEHGYSVRQMIDACRRVTGKAIAVQEASRRPGDPPALVASARKIRETLNWVPQYQDLDAIIQTAWQWEQQEAARVNPAIQA